jgi:hypothetical protein
LKGLLNGGNAKEIQSWKESHSIFFKGTGKSAKLMIASSPTILESFLNDIEGKPEYKDAQRNTMIKSIRGYITQIEELRKNPLNSPNKLKPKLKVFLPR